MTVMVGIGSSMLALASGAPAAAAGGGDSPAQAKATLVTDMMANISNFWTPALNPLVTVFCVRNYRRAIFRAMLDRLGTAFFHTSSVAPLQHPQQQQQRHRRTQTPTPATSNPNTHQQQPQ
jgi:hypothetical protein